MSEPMYQLHPQLEKDCFRIIKLELCELLLMNDTNYPWFILVPMVDDICEIYQFWYELRLKR